MIGSDAYYFECLKIAKAKGACLFAVPRLRAGSYFPACCVSARRRKQLLSFVFLHVTRQQQARARGFSPPFRVCAPRRDGIIAQAPQTAPAPLRRASTCQKLEKRARGKPSPTPRSSRGLPAQLPLLRQAPDHRSGGGYPGLNTGIIKNGGRLARPPF